MQKESERKGSRGREKERQVEKNKVGEKEVQESTMLSICILYLKSKSQHSC